jgi:phospholipid/cholesterol/gamma-HCH transport system ATP-binding protein
VIVNKSVVDPFVRGVTVSENGRRPYFQLKHVSKSFGSDPVLEDASFAVMPGETVCILGRSGVGKSVTLRIFMGFLKPDSGRVITAGDDITDYSEEELERIHRKVTMVFQNGALFDSLTVWENVAFPLRERGDLKEEQIEAIVEEVLDLVKITSLSDCLPPEISTGMKRAVAIARALAARPEAILYDEPTTMVDPLMARQLGNLIRRLKAQMSLTSMVVTHDMRLVSQVADHVVFLNRGKVIFMGTREEMERASEPLVQQFLQLDRVDLRAAVSMLEPGSLAV